MMPGAGGRTCGGVEAVGEGLRVGGWLVCVVGRGGSSVEMMLVPQPILTQLIPEAGHALDLLLVGENDA